MKVSLINYVHASNGISLQVTPETDIEEAVLQTFWSHGAMETGHPESKGGNATTGFYIRFKPPANPHASADAGGSDAREEEGA